MKNKIGLRIAVVLLLFAALAFASCKEPGGTIEVTNEYKIGNVGLPIMVTIVEGFDFADAVKNIETKGEVIQYGKTKTFTFDKDGTYTVVSVPPADVFTETVVLFQGNTEKVTVK
jgi:hypothetical protein